MSVIKAADEIGSRARSDRRYLQGTVVGIGPNNTARVDVGATLADGTKVYFENVPYTPQSPPAVGSVIALEYGSSSMHSARITAAGLAYNTPDNLTIVGGVASLGIDTEGAPQKGDLLLHAGTGITLSRSGKTFTIRGSGSVGAAVHPGNILVADEGLNWVPATLIIDEAGAIVVGEDGNPVWGEP